MKKNKRNRKSNGQFRMSYWEHFKPLVYLILGVFMLGLIWIYFQDSEVIGPCEGGCEFTFVARASEIPQNESFGQSVKTNILRYIVDVFGDDSADIITMIRKCENSTFEQERGNHNTNGTYDKGVMQINSIHLSGSEFPVCKEAHNDWKANIDCGKAIFDKYGISAWSCSHVVDVTPFYLK